MSANAGLVIRTPIVNPIRVVTMNPRNSPAPAHHRGINENIVVKYAAITM